MAPIMPVRPLGSQGLKASAQGLGCMGMSTAYKDKMSPVTDEESIACIHKALELGVTFLDTSDMYGPFTNEELVGESAFCRQNLACCGRLKNSTVLNTAMPAAALQPACM